MSYFDSAYIAKFYLDEPESEAGSPLAESLRQVRSNPCEQGVTPRDNHGAARADLGLAISAD